MGVAKAVAGSLGALPGQRNGRAERFASTQFRPVPIKTASARAIKDFSTILETIQTRAPLRRNTDPAEVADTAVFLASDLGRGVTGNCLFVDAGMQVMGF